VLFTDLVASTEHASAMGDERWRDLLGRFQEVTAEALRDANGRLIKSLGDGHLATFDGPAQAISGAQAIIDAAAKMGLDVRAGVHVGECEVIERGCPRRHSSDP
jgi:class 3 adenylate cyclase